jgi:hypothetical protein
VQREARVAQQPALDRPGLVDRGVVEHDVNVEVRRHRALDQIEEATQLLGAMARGHVGDDLAGGDVERAA